MATGKLAKRYNPIQLLGAGAMGEVWLVEDTLSGDRQAMKIISRDLAAREKPLLQFRQEFHLMTQLQHPNCCEVFDFGQLPDGSPFFTMEYVPGVSLGERLPLPADEIRQVLSQLLLALGHLHRRELVHRDIKSDNVRIRPDGVVKLMDFGLMEYAGRAGGGLTGTFPYLPPEVALQGPVDQRSDLYSVGILAYEMLTGRRPFRQEKPLEILKAHLNERPERPSRLRASIDPTLEAVVLRLLEKNPVDRFQTAYDVLAALGVEVPATIGAHLLSSPLIGHEPQREALAAQIARVKDGRPGHALFLTGGLGLGKSRLAREYRYRAQLEGLPVAVASHREHSQSPYDPAVMALRGLLPIFKEHVRADLDRLAPILVKLLPELGAEPAPELDSPANEKQRVQGAVVELLAALGQRCPFVLVLEDAQWADPLSIELFQYTRRATAELPVGFLVTSREPPSAASRATGRLEHLTLDPLPRVDLEAMVTAMLGTTMVAGAFLDQVEAFSSGNPLFVERLLEHLVQERILVHDGGWNTDVDLSAARLPASLQDLILMRVGSLSPDARALAHVVAVVGRPTGIDLLLQASELREEALFKALEGLLINHVLVQTEAGDYGFAQDQFQEVVYTGLPVKERGPLHARVAAALERQIGGRSLGEVPMEVVMAIATHHMLASDARKTMRYALEAGVRNARLFAPTIAEGFLRAGLEVVDALDDPDASATRLQYLRWLGDVSRMMGKFEAARDAYVAALPLAQELGDRALYGRMATSLAKALQSLGAYQEALEWARRSQQFCQAEGDAPGAARAHLTSARLMTVMGEGASAVGHTLRALALAREVDDRLQMGQALACLGYLRVSHQQGQAAQGLEALNEALGLLAETGDKMELLYAQAFAGDAHFTLGDFLAAQEAYAETLRLAEEIDNAADRCGALMNLANVALELGNYPRAAAVAAEAVAAALPDRYLGSVSSAVEASAYRAQGRLEKARESLARAERLAAELGNPLASMLVGLHALEAELELGQYTKTATRAQVLSARLPEADTAEHGTRLHVALAFLHGRRGNWADARAAAEKALTTAEAAEAQALQARALYAHAWLALQAGRWDDARDDAGQAWAIATRIHAQALSAALHGILGEVALATGTGKAAPHFQAMTELARASGSPLLLAEAMFGLAAAVPYGPHAAEQAKEAREILADLRALVPEADREAFLQPRERARIWEGNHIAFSLPVAKPKAGGTGTLRPELWRME